VILGYPQDPTVRAGGRLVLRVSTDAPAFCVLVYRCGAELEPVAVTGWLLVNTLLTTPKQALIGLALILLGLPVYWYWARHNDRVNVPPAKP